MNKTSSHTITKLGLAVAATLLASSAGAASFTWNFENTAGLPGSSFVETSLSGGQTITMKAYSATNNTTATWTAANFTNQATAGLGILHSGEPSTAPQHAIDSVNNTDFVLIDAGVGKTFDWTQLEIGYGVDNYNTGSEIANQADIKLWTGNTLPGTLTGNNIAGFSQTSLSNVAINSLTSIDGGSGGNLSPSRYLIIAGDVNDAFKLKEIRGQTGTPPSQVPEPAPIALLGLGLLGFTLARRRSV